MTERILDISEAPARLKVDLGRLHIEQGEAAPMTIPLEEVAVLMVAHYQVSYTQAVLAGLMAAGGVFICCDASRLPTGLMLPLAGHHQQTRRVALQAGAAKPVRKRLWQQLIQAKIAGQGRVLTTMHGDDLGLAKMAQRVKSGDPDNLEAQAARKYWRPLFQEDAFRRDQEADGANALLNYGYGVLRAIVGRAVCATGLHPSLGIHHKNQYNPYCLVDDLMEPYRPLVDRVVAHYTCQGNEAVVDKAFKGAMIGGLLQRYPLDGEARSLFDCAHRTAHSVVEILEGTRANISLPECIP